MSITVRIRGAPPQDGESLCQTCRYAHIQKGFRESEQTVFCGFNDAGLRPIKFKVAACTDYTNRTVPNRWELEQMALLDQRFSGTQEYGLPSRRRFRRARGRGRSGPVVVTE